MQVIQRKCPSSYDIKNEYSHVLGFIVFCPEDIVLGFISSTYSSVNFNLW